ncbi:MAG: hypothetical protein ACKOZM_00060 [Flavobacteriales bacterium]
MQKSWAFLLFLLISCNGFAQRNIRPLYVPGGEFSNKGWFIAPGLAFTLPFPRNEQLTGYDAADDTLFSGDFSRDGQNGLCLQVGRHHFWEHGGLIDHVDYGLGYKMLRGTEDFSGIVRSGNSFTPMSSQGVFSDSYLSAFGNLNNVAMLSNRWWIQNSLGLNVDFRLFGNRGGSAPLGLQWQYPVTFPMQLHYRFGIGWKPEAGIHILPMIEIPLVNVFEWEGLQATLPYFSGRYRPILITLRIQWLTRAPMKQCPDKPNQQVDLSKGGRRNENDLFGPDAKKMKRKKKGFFHFLKRS